MKAARAVREATSRGSQVARYEIHEPAKPSRLIQPEPMNFQTFPPVQYVGPFKKFGLPKFRCDCNYSAGFLLMFLHLTEYHQLGGSKALYLLDMATKENEDQMDQDARREIQEVRSAVAAD